MISKKQTYSFESICFVSLLKFKRVGEDEQEWKFAKASEDREENNIIT
jgi:hypothetical protein